MELANRPKFVRWALMLGIVVILNVFFSVLVSLAFPAPEYASFCPAAAGGKPVPADVASCDHAGGTWTEYSLPSPPDGVTKASGYCDLYAKCQAPYQAAQDQHALYAFALMIGLGILALILGFLPLGSSIVGSGLSYGGVLALIVGSASYWGTAGNWIRLAIAAIGLAALVYLGIKKFSD